MITLYQYLHCPYCIRVRMTLGLLNIPYHSIILPYSDEITPIQLTGKKMAPFIKKEDGTYLNESLDIMEYLDELHVLKIPTTKKTDTFLQAENFITTISTPLFNLLMPFYLNGKEFSDQDKIYFQRQKEIKRGPFHKLVQRRKEFIGEINIQLENLYQHLRPYYQSSHVGLCDILIASHLWGMYLAHTYRVPSKLNDYLQSISSECRFVYDTDLWKTS